MKDASPAVCLHHKPIESDVNYSRTVSAPSHQVTSSYIDDVVDSIDDVCRKLARQKYGEQPTAYISARQQANYYSPEDQYEAFIDRLVNSDSSWLDVGCGRAPFPNNLSLSAMLSDRCQHLTGIDPDSSVHENPFIHERHQLSLDEYYPNCTFGVVTARMVIEHVTDPDTFATALNRVTTPGSVVVIFTVNWWSLTTLAAYFSPFVVHHAIKRIFWNTNLRETFPTMYKLNRRRTLHSTMTKAGFRELHFRIIPDASLLWRIPVLRYAELNIFKLFKRLRIPYIDSCLLAVYQRCAHVSHSPSTVPN
jgi:2-polyprenyl-3-methyl-5-hydroxy-6-metoxy-1,4-benzoquinol methylase